MSLAIRPVRNDDYDQLAAIGSAALPGLPQTAEEMREEDAAPPPVKTRRWVAELDGRPVATASYFQSETRYHAQKFWMDAYVHPDCQGQGIGAALYDTVLAAVLPHQPVQLRTFTREDVPRAITFFERRGFVEGKRTWVSSLDLEQVDLAPFAHTPPAVAGQGIAIGPLSALQGEAGWEQTLLDLYNALQADIPDIDPAVAMSLETFQQSHIGSQKFMPDAYLIARDGDRWVGMSSLWKGSEPGQMAIGVTGVLPAYRGRGIAMALKVRGIEWARQMGWKRMTTMNASTNQPILAMNERLGFVREPAWLHLIRTF